MFRGESSIFGKVKTLLGGFFSRKAEDLAIDREVKTAGLNDRGASTIDALIGVAIGLIVLVAVFSIAPMIGNSIDSATALPATSQWNSSVNTDIPTAVDLWEDTGALIALAAMVVVLGIVIGVIMYFRR